MSAGRRRCPATVPRFLNRAAGGASTGRVQQDAFWAPKSPTHNPAYNMVDPTSSYGAAYGGSGGAAASAPRPRPLGAAREWARHAAYPSSLVDAAAAPTWDGRADALCRLVLDTALDARVSPAHAALAHASPPPAWGGGSPQPLSSPLACGQVVHALAVVADGGAGGAATLLTAGRDKIIRGYSLRGALRAAHAAHSDRIWDLLPLGGGAFASASADRNVRIWQLRRGDHDYARGATPPPRRSPPAGGSLPSALVKTATLAGHTEAVQALLLHRGLLASASADATVRLWNTATHRHAGTCSLPRRTAEEARQSTPCRLRGARCGRRTGVARSTGCGGGRAPPQPERRPLWLGVGPHGAPRPPHVIASAGADGAVGWDAARRRSSTSRCRMRVRAAAGAGLIAAGGYDGALGCGSRARRGSSRASWRTRRPSARSSSTTMRSGRARPTGRCAAGICRSSQLATKGGVRSSIMRPCDSTHAAESLHRERTRVDHGRIEVGVLGDESEEFARAGQNDPENHADANDVGPTECAVDSGVTGLSEARTGRRHQEAVSSGCAVIVVTGQALRIVPPRPPQPHPST